MTRTEPSGKRPKGLTVGRVGVYAFLLGAAAFFLIPLWIMILTSFKPMEEVRLGNILAFPVNATAEPWVTA